MLLGRDAAQAVEFIKAASQGLRYEYMSGTDGEPLPDGDKRLAQDEAMDELALKKTLPEEDSYSEASFSIITRASIIF